MAKIIDLDKVRAGLTRAPDEAIPGEPICIPGDTGGVDSECTVDFGCNGTDAPCGIDFGCTTDEAPCGIDVGCKQSSV